MDPAESEAEAAQSVGELTLATTTDLRETLTQIDALAKALGVELPDPAARS